MNGVLATLLPWSFSPAVLLLCAGGAVAYGRGLRRTPRTTTPGLARRLSFYAGCALVYGVLQTRFDFLAQHMFFLHRLQHLVLHHLGPVLVVLARPGEVLARGMPALRTRVLLPVWRHPLTRSAYRGLQNAVTAPLLFVGLICFWLIPSIHFDAMLSTPLYELMNWSMLLDGLAFWVLMLDPRTRCEGALLGFGPRLLIVLLAIFPQIAVGAHIALSADKLYAVYGVCGRAWAIDPAADQTWGGLVTWIPAAMMHVVVALVLLARWMHADGGPEPAGDHAGPASP